MVREPDRIEGKAEKTGWRRGRRDAAGGEGVKGFRCIRMACERPLMMSWSSYLFRLLLLPKYSHHRGDHQCGIIL